MTPEQKTALDLRAQGKSRAEIAASMGKSETAVKSLLERARKWVEADPAAQKAANAAGSNVLPHSFWVKTDTHSIYYKTPQDEASKQEWWVDAFKDIPAYEPQPVTLEDSSLLSVYPVFDLHHGMLAWSDETGAQSYDLDIAASDLRASIARLHKLAPEGGEALLILGGDTLHIDDGRNETPQSRHKLDADGRYYKVLDTAIKSIAWLIEALAARHHKVKVRVLAGNHDIHSHLAMSFALAERYRNTDRIVVEKNPHDLFMHRHGSCLIAAHHGDKSPPARLAMYLSDICPYWSETRHRHILTGHIHHDSAKDFPGVKWQSLRAFCPPDAYSAGYGSRRALRVMVFDDKRGLVLTAEDGVE